MVINIIYLLNTEFPFLDISFSLLCSVPLISTFINIINLITPDHILRLIEELDAARQRLVNEVNKYPIGKSLVDDEHFSCGKTTIRV